jgi:hypothetical protein
MANKYKQCQTKRKFLFGEKTLHAEDKIPFVDDVRLKNYLNMLKLK